ncbi:hypothetical protein JTB14_023402 [Gonioctena quinquepunctata]|nr:hypothetical protein JTB14_023402 [Gonioctena quinquepunctata]
MIAMEPWRSYATICRLCLQKDGFMLGIFNHIQGKDRSIYKKIIDCTALQISHGDGLPNVICHRCLFKIEFCLEFRQLCFMSDATLRQLAGVNKENGPDTPITRNCLFTNNWSQQVTTKTSSWSSILSRSTTNPITSPRRSPRATSRTANPTIKNLKVEVHEMTAHNSDTPYTCTTCYMSFADRVLYSAHLKSVHKNDKPYNCPQCDRTFARRSDLRKHTIVHTGVKPFTCTVCYKSFSRNTNLSKHMRIHSGTKPFVCPKCPKTFTSKADLSRHSIIHSGQRPFSCNYCHLSFGRKDKLQRHEKRHFPQENSEDKSHELQMLRENLSIYSNANENKDEGEMKQDGSENMVITLDPFNHNSYPSDATPHRGDNSENEPHNDLEGSIIDESLEDDMKEIKQESEVSHENFEMNAKMSAGLKSFKCGQCLRRFSKAENLQKHQATHAGSRPFSCHICNKSFIRKRELDRHIATHSGMKPFKCPRCSKSFGRKDKMIRHMRIHDIKKSFNCEICGSTFNRRDGLQQHMKTHVIKQTEDEKSLV